MNWNELFSNDKTPTYNDIENFINNPLWIDILNYLETTYKVKPSMSYSKCAAQPGWNVKFQKSGKSLCTLYPMEGYFIALVVVGAKEETQVELASKSLSPYVSNLYRSTPFSCGGRWLMIEVKNREALDDVKKLINIRIYPK